MQQIGNKAGLSQHHCARDSIPLQRFRDTGREASQTPCITANPITNRTRTVEQTPSSHPKSPLPTMPILPMPRTRRINSSLSACLPDVHQTKKRYESRTRPQSAPTEKSAERRHAPSPSSNSSPALVACSAPSETLPPQKKIRTRQKESANQKATRNPISRLQMAPIVLAKARTDITDTHRSQRTYYIKTVNTL
jgi:hypothetical protein